MPKITIRRCLDHSLWYDAYVGGTFEVIQEKSDRYIVNNPFSRSKSEILKSDCIESEPNTYEKNLSQVTCGQCKKTYQRTTQLKSLPSYCEQCRYSLKDVESVFKSFEIVLDEYELSGRLLPRHIRPNEKVEFDYNGLKITASLSEEHGFLLFVHEYLIDSSKNILNNFGIPFLSTKVLSGFYFNQFEVRAHFQYMVTGEKVTVYVNNRKLGSKFLKN